jgi:hypothetical protein
MSKVVVSELDEKNLEEINLRFLLQIIDQNELDLK